MTSQTSGACPVILVNWNSWDDTFACLASLRESGEAPPVWIVDNGSDVDRSDEARAIYSDLRVIALDDNYGLTVARNRGLQEAALQGYEFAYLLDNDCKVTPGFLSCVLEAARNNDRFAAVGSRTAYMDTPDSLMYDGTFYHRGEHPIDQTDEVKVVFETPGAASLFRLAAMESVGYFDERFFIYGEMTEWCSRLRDRGWQAAIAGASLVYHRRHRSDHNANEHYYRVRNYFLQHPPETQPERLLRLARFIYRELRQANELRRTGQVRGAYTIVDGLWDGARGRFGRRGRSAPRPVAYLLANFWVFPAGAIRRTVSRARDLARKFLDSR